MANSHVDGKTWSVPFQRSTMIAYYNKRAFEQAGLDPDAFPTTWAGAGADRANADGTEAGRVSRWGIKIAGDLGNAQWTFGALTNQAGAKLMNEAGTATAFDAPKAVEALTYWRRPRDARQAHAAGHRRLADAVARFPGGQRRHHVHHHGQPHQRAQERPLPVRGRQAAGRQAARHATVGRWQPLRPQDRRRRPRGRRLPVRALPVRPRARRRMGASRPATWRRAPTPGRRPP